MILLVSGKSAIAVGVGSVLARFLSYVIPYVERPRSARVIVTGFATGRRCAHMSGLFHAAVWSLALMKSAA